MLACTVHPETPLTDRPRRAPAPDMTPVPVSTRVEISDIQALQRLTDLSIDLKAAGWTINIAFEASGDATRLTLSATDGVRA
jgi:hypothetical protein